MEADPKKPSTSKKIKLDSKAESRKAGTVVYTDMFIQNSVIQKDTSSIHKLSMEKDDGVLQKHISIKKTVKQLVDSTVARYKKKIEKLFERLTEEENTLKEAQNKYEKSEN